MSSRSITIVSSGRSPALDHSGNSLVLIPIILFCLSLNSFKADLDQLRVHFCSLLGLRMHDTELPSQPKLPLEDDRESGIGSTLDLSVNFEGYNRHTNQHSNTPSLREADRLPEEKGTRVAWRGEAYIYLLGLAAGLIYLKRQLSWATCSLDTDMPKRHRASGIAQSGQQKKSHAVTQLCLAAYG